jgi:hypothetical protein
MASEDAEPTTEEKLSLLKKAYRSLKQESERREEAMAAERAAAQRERGARRLSLPRSSSHVVPPNSTGSEQGVLEHEPPRRRALAREAPILPCAHPASQLHAYPTQISGKRQCPLTLNRRRRIGVPPPSSPALPPVLWPQAVSSPAWMSHVHRSDGGPNPTPPPQTHTLSQSHPLGGLLSRTPRANPAARLTAGGLLSRVDELTRELESLREAVRRAGHEARERLLEDEIGRLGSAHGHAAASDEVRDEKKRGGAG